MRLRTLLVFAALAAAFSVSAKDVYLPVAGSVGVFKTDARIFNPANRDIEVRAWFLPNGNVDNTAIQPITITVPKRQVMIFNDVVSSLFHASGLGGIRLSSADDFVATQRVYATSTTCAGSVNPCTLGQFLVAVDATGAKKSAVVIQLASGAFFRTNLGALNPNATPATVTWRVYDKNNLVVGTPKVVVMPPWSVVGPSNMTTFSDGIPSASDLSDSWVGYTSDQPIVAYGSVVDNGSTDQTYVPAIEDSNPPVATDGPPPTASYDVTLRNGQIDVQPVLKAPKVGDKLAFHVHAVDPKHGFTLVSPSGQTLIADRSGASGFAVGTAFDQTITINEEGTYSFFCTHPTCSGGHVSMSGTFDVGAASGGPGGYYP